jgi:hypothetical protein
MATRSTIALEFADNTVQQVYCHWDGYLEHNGAILQGYYMDPFKVRDLIDLGDLSSLGPTLGEAHEFDCPHAYGTPEYNAWSEAKQQVCTFYGRDRGETGTGANKFKDVADYEANGQSEEYDYILKRDGNWYVRYYETNGAWVSLTEALKKTEVLEGVEA